MNERAWAESVAESMAQSVNTLLEETYAEAEKTGPAKVKAWHRRAARRVALELAEEDERARLRRERRKVARTETAHASNADD